ncbi:MULTISPECIES: hypothetical protein [Bacteroides]|uniref:hypothetical protein n=1 Tax=Bacteroides TaxID=816 RepID=UPI0013145F1F|nr:MULTISPECIES: hypothetical protein [Bacteroides]MBS7575448.1 hypothetical protein [Bacteroides propionicigenes]
MLHVFLRPAVGNRRARSWQPYGPQLATVQPAAGKRDNARSVVGFCMKEHGFWQYV